MNSSVPRLSTSTVITPSPSVDASATDLQHSRDAHTHVEGSCVLLLALARPPSGLRKPAGRAAGKPAAKPKPPLHGWELATGVTKRQAGSRICSTLAAGGQGSSGHWR